MKRNLFIVFVLFSIHSFSQSIPKEDLDIIQDIYGKSKSDLVNEYMNLKEPQASAFQKIYDQYEVSRKELGSQKIQLVNDYVNNFQLLDDKKAAELAQANLKNNIDLDKLLSKTYHKVEKAVGGLNAAKFVELEQYLQVTIRGEIQDAIPFIDEIEKRKLK